MSEWDWLRVHDYRPPESLWELVEELAPLSELHEIKKLIGIHLIDHSLELHQEISMLLEFIQDIQHFSNEFVNDQHFPEPPAVRESLKQEIKFLVQSIKEKAKQEKQPVEEQLARYNPNIIKYAFYEDTQSMKPLLEQSKPASQQYLIQEKANILNVEETLNKLRKSLQEEIHQSLKDINLLQGWLEDQQFAVESRSVSTTPSLTELKEERSKLEKEVLASVESTPSVQLKTTSSDMITCIKGSNNISKLNQIIKNASTEELPIQRPVSLISLKKSHQGSKPMLPDHMKDLILYKQKRDKTVHTISGGQNKGEFCHNIHFQEQLGEKLPSLFNRHTTGGYLNSISTSKPDIQILHSRLGFHHPSLPSISEKMKTALMNVRSVPPNLQDSASVASNDSISKTSLNEKSIQRIRKLSINCKESP